MHLPIILVAVLMTPALASWHAILPRQTPASTPTPVQTGEALDNCLWTSYKIHITKPKSPPELEEYRSSAMAKVTEHPYLASATASLEQLDRTSVCSIYLGLSSQQLSLLPSELSTVFSSYEESRTSWIKEVKPQVSEYSRSCVGIVGTSEVGDFLQEFATDVQECVTNAEMVFGKFVPATTTKTKDDIEVRTKTGEWEILSTSVTTTDSTAAGARETGYLGPILGIVGAVAWAGAAGV
ncbi:hypothetical protein QBC40DRAFT_81321 [Triangularia verruculosa]|uniref:Uncharacterized protein n=1 Tax=Triangularia verruculosa TaxID=2587418 RepID=A0AAN7ASH4_9PEZI|nr:hypothetical protein QBC40DRAFT_81321 [Triangularia verruculosa]